MKRQDRPTTGFGLLASVVSRRRRQLPNISVGVINRSSSSQSGPLAPTPRLAPDLFQLKGCWLVLALFSVARCSWPVLAYERVHFGQQPNPDRLVLMCNRSNCLGESDLQFEWPRDDSHLVRVVSSRAGARFRLDQLGADQLSFAGRQSANPQQHRESLDRIVDLDINRHSQQIAGYGGAFTDSASSLIMSLPDELRNSLIASYFGPHGLDYNLGRVPIGGTDMSWRAYSCNDLPDGEEDFALSKFALQHEDLAYKLPLISMANQMRRSAAAEPIKLLASSWSAPNWMKTGHNLVQGKLKGSSRGQYYDAYARYVIKFLDEYEQRLNASVWALTPQNEPCSPNRLGPAIINFNSNNFEPDEMMDYLRLHLVPNLVRRDLERQRRRRRQQQQHAATSPNPGHNNDNNDKLALFVWDDNLLGLDKYTNMISQLNNDTQTYEYIRGLAIHWYSQGLGKVPYKYLYDTRRLLPGKFSLISTEASFISPPLPGDWKRGERYARDIIENLRSGSIGWIDWNLALNMGGGPTWSANYLDAAILIDEHKQVAYKNPMFYAIGHMSRFLRRNSHVVASSVFSPSGEGRERHQKSGGIWKMVSEEEEATSELLVAAAELEPELEAEANDEINHDGKSGPKSVRKWRQIGLVMLNRASRSLRTQLNLANCRSQLVDKQRALIVELEAESIASFAFNC